ncbi:MAG: alkaline phosphatase [Spirochaetaceae bacterium]|nr:alkaline phosphatase [Spirochaetaceae bacterium]
MATRRSRRLSPPLMAFLAFLAAMAIGSSCSLFGMDASGRAGPRHVFLFIGDGMSYGSEVAASRYLYGADEGLAWHVFPFRAWAATWDASAYDLFAADASAPVFAEDSFDPLLGYDPARGGDEPWPLGPDARAYLLRAATDSASAATAIATGLKTENGNIAWARGDPAGGALVTIAESARSRLGSAVGIVSTVPFNHATPAAFSAHSPRRDSYAGIAAEILGSTRPDVLVGGGHPAWNATYFSSEALADLKASGAWTVVERAAGLDGGDSLAAAAAALGAGGRLFGLFGGGDGAFEAPIPLDNPGAPAFVAEPENPSLAEAVAAAIDALARDPDGFLLVAEQGDVDWANHANDFPRMLGAIASLDAAVRTVVDFVDRPGDGIDWGNSLLVVTADHGTGLLRFDTASAIGKGALPSSRTGAVYSYPGGTVSYNATSHQNELVGFAARGDAAVSSFGDLLGAGRPGTRILDNTDIYRGLADFLGLR